MGLKEYIVSNIKKKFWARLSLLSFILAVWTVLDEYVKEGYFFHISEVTNPLCHEFWTAVLLLISAVSYAIHMLRGRRNEDVPIRR